jgi:pilus assembly protein CpaC
MSFLPARGLLGGLCLGSLVLLSATAAAPPGHAQEVDLATASEVVGTEAPLVIEVRKGRVIRLPQRAAAVFIADPDTADVQVHSPSLVYLLGRRAGTTSLYAVDERDRVLFRRDIVVEHNLGGLRQVMSQIAPGTSAEVASIDGGILLSGSVGDARVAEDLRDAVGRYLGAEEKIVNRLAVAGPTQVNLRVRVAEVSREVFKLFGFNWEALFSPGDFAFGLATGRPLAGGNALTSRFFDTNGAAGAISGSYSSNNVSIDGVIDALERDGLVNVLAEPNLTALSGETASFLAGGEFPVPVGVDDDQIQIEFKEFGVSLAFTPTVLDPGRISLKVRPEVSELSDNGAIKLADLVIPALSTRRAETTVELGSGQSFAIGGLISNATRTNMEKLPGLGDLPVLGTLFRSSNFRRQESELVIIVTPYLVRPVSPPALAVPNDAVVEATDLERILLGRLAHPTGPAGNPGASRPSGRLVGPAGFDID